MYRKKHFISMDNFFTSIELFEELVSRQIYATGIMRSNQIELPLNLKITSAFKNVTHGTLEWKMYQSYRMTSIVWKLKKPILLSSTHAISIGYPCMLVPTILRRNGVVWEDIMTSPMFLKYTIHICGVDGRINYEHHIVHRTTHITST